MSRFLTKGLLRGSEVTSFELQLQTSLVALARGSGTPTFTRATTAYQTDFEGKQNLVLSGEARMQGARRVRNGIVTSSENFSAWLVDGAATVTAGQSDPLGGTTAYKIANTTAGNGVFNAPIFSGANDKRYSVWLCGEVGGEVITVGATGLTVTLTTSWLRYSTLGIGTDTNFLLRPTGANKTFYAWRAQAEQIAGQANQNPSEYVSVGVLSAPYHGAGVDGVKYFNYLNPNTVADNIVTEG